MGEQLFRLAYPSTPQFREPASQTEQRLVAGQQIGAGPPSQFEKFLVVGIAAMWQMPGVRGASHAGVRRAGAILQHQACPRGLIE